MDLQTASLSSFAGRNATFLLAAICIVSPVAGLRPVRFALAHLQCSQPIDPDAIALLKVPRDTVNHSNQKIVSQLLGHLMSLRKLLEDAF